jgi:RNA polymerase sigma-70 factor (ECF subfamily)
MLCYRQLQEAEGEPVRPVDPSEWVDRYGDYLFRYAMLRVRDRSRAEDLVQETFLAALKSRKSFSGDSSEATWLVAILKHKIFDHFRRQSREAPLPERDLPDAPGSEPFDARGHWTDGPKEWGADPAELFHRKEFRERLRKCLEALSPNLASAFTLREIDGADTKEICKVLRVTETNLWVILHRARARLRECLETHWLGRSPKEGS